MDKNPTIFPPAGFILLTVACVAALFIGLTKALRKTTLSAAEQKSYQMRFLIVVDLWLAASGVLAYAGILSDFKSLPPKFVIVLVVPMILVAILLMGKRTNEILRHVPPQHLIALQVFRVPVEILLWRLYVEGSLPVQMTFEGLNWDVLTGITAPIVAWFSVKDGKVRKPLILVWNLLGFLLLLNIVTIAITSTPSPLRLFMNEPANTVVTEFPFVWLPAFLVPLAYGLHFLSWKQLRLLNHQSPA